MEIKYGLISVDDHVQETPDLWASRMSKGQWGDRIPHLQDQEDGSQVWLVDGQKLNMEGVASAGALMADRNQEPQRWDEVPRAAYLPSERLRAMDADGLTIRSCIPRFQGYRERSSVV